MPLTGIPRTRTSKDVVILAVTRELKHTLNSCFTVQNTHAQLFPLLLLTLPQCALKKQKNLEVESRNVTFHNFQSVPSREESLKKMFAELSLGVQMQITVASAFGHDVIELNFLL